MSIAPDPLEVGPHRIGLTRLFTSQGVDPYDEVVWERRDARITNWTDGSVAFEQLAVEFPFGWSQNATNIVAQKYFRGTLGAPERESSLRQVVDRVVDTITRWGIEGAYFADESEATAFSDELKYILVTQRAAFNSPVWFNIGVDGVPQQASACYILEVDDTMDSILEWYRQEGLIFKGGSGAGTNLSKIRSSAEHLRGGGTASGPVSFMRGADASAGTIKSGGKTRRAAKMVILNADHPDIDEFVACKAIEERKIRVLRDNGFDMELDGKDSFSVQYQNANNSVRVTDEFMQAVIADADWDLKAVKTGETLRTIKARDLWHRIAEAAWESADPGLQFDTTINRWHTLPNSGRIEASNPCAEFLSLNNSACNLASINLIPFLDDDRFDVGAFKHAVELVFTAQEILAGRADYPTEKLTQNSHDFRQLGLGYTNLGAMLMALGLPYDSTAGRAWAAAITSLMTGHAYATSARTAARIGPFAGFAENEEHMLRVLRMHRDAAHQVEGIDAVPSYVVRAGHEAWDAAVRDGEEHGVRNSQASTLAPTGTISFMMDADTTGIEPDLSLVKTKKLVGGGSMSIVNQTVPRALAHLGYDDDQIAEIVAYIDHEKSVIGAPHLAVEHLPVFACSMGDNTIHYEGHVRMLAAVQPFISGAVSKCIAGQSLVPSTDGLVRIASLHHDEPVDTFRDEILGVDSLTGLQKTSAFYYGGKRHVRRLVLRSGHHVTGTSNHRVLVATEGGLDWRRLDEIQPGELVATKYGAELWSDLPARFDDFVSTPAYGSQKRVRIPTEMDETLAFLLGAYAAEGCTTANYTIRFTNSVPEARDRMMKSWKEAFDLDAKVADDGVRCPDVIVASKTVTEFFKYLGIGSRASEKRIPDAILMSPRDHVLAFLDGLSLDANATVSGGAKWAICLDSPRLLDDLQAVLTNLGIVHRRISKFNRTNGKTYDEVYATGRHARRLCRLIPFLEPDKAVRAAQLVAKPIGQNAWDIIPIDPRQLHDLLPNAKSGRNSAGRVRSRFTYLLDQRTRYPSRRTVEMAQVMGAKLPPWISQLIDDEMYLSPVESVDDAGVQEVYDLAVPSTQSFVANGIMNHNTTNMPEMSTVEEVKHLHQLAWELGLKSIAIYRDNCKVGQPLSTTKKVVTTAPEAVVVLGAGQIVERVIEKIVHRPVRQKLPRNRRSRTYEFRVADCKGFLTVGEYDDGRPGEVFLTVSKQGSTLAGIMDAFAKSISYGLQYGVPLRAFVEAFTNMRFEPAGITDDPEIRFASSVMDYLFRKLAMEYLSYDERAELSIFSVSERLQPTLPGMEESIVETTSGTEMATDPKSVPTAGELADQMDAGTMAITPVDNTPAAGVIRDSDAPMCMQCGVTMIRAGSCHACPSCGSTSGCS